MSLKPNKSQILKRKGQQQPDSAQVEVDGREPACISRKVIKDNYLSSQMMILLCSVKWKIMLMRQRRCMKKNFSSTSPEQY
jgi:hypothetical protein